MNPATPADVLAITTTTALMLGTTWWAWATLTIAVLVWLSLTDRRRHVG